MSRQGQGVLIMAGGTGGHIFPGLAVAEWLRSQGIAVRWLGASRRHGVPACACSRYLAGHRRHRRDQGKGPDGLVCLPWRLFRAVYQAFVLLGANRPACAVSFGGYAAGPGGLAVKLRGIPLLVHEQNRIPGMTNRVLARFANMVLQAFPGTWQKTVQAATCGNPVRESLVSL